MSKQKRDGCGNPIDPDALYYVEDTRGLVGNCMSLWCPDGKGYTCELDAAGWYKGHEVTSMRDTDVPWPMSLLERSAIRHVRMDSLRTGGAGDA